MSETKKRPRLTAIIFAVITAVLAAVLVGLIMRFDLLPYKYLNLLAAGLAALLLIPSFFACFRKARVVSVIFSILISAGLSLGIFYFVKTERALQQMGQAEDTVNFTVLTTAADSLAPDKALENGKIAVVDAVMGEYIPDARSAVSAEWPGAEFVSYGSYFEACEALLAGEADGVLFFEGFRDMMEESFENFSVNTAIVKTVALPEIKQEAHESGQESDAESETEDEDPVVKDLTNSPFVVVLLGSDSRSEKLPTNSNHDVNIVTVVNPVSKVILMISVPRDFYVDVPYSTTMKDKLTHCGAWGGAETSVKALNNLLGTSAKHYVKIGFSGFVSVVDALGGIDVYSEVAFYAAGTKYHFTAGINHLNGDQALAFSRERYNLGSLGGDRQRGTNQMAVIKAIMQKALSPAILTNYLPLLNSLSGMIKYNFTQEEIASLVKMQLDDMASWSIYSYSVNGTGTFDYTASYPREELYVMVPTQKTVDNAKQYIQEVYEGKRPSIGQ